MNFLTQIGIGLVAVIMLFAMSSQCSSKKEEVDTKKIEELKAAYQPAKVTLREFSKGLNLDAVTLLAKKAKDGADFERLLNTKDEGVNNIDLNKDDKVDYIKVTEYGSGDQRGFSLTTEISPGEVQEIATIEFKKEANGAAVQTTGNPSLYGASNFLHSNFGLTDMLLMGWLFSNRPSYASPHGYNNYPPHYGGGWNRQGDDQYAGSMSSRTAGSTLTRSSQPLIKEPTLSPNAQKTAARAQALANPTRSQRSFTKPASAPTSSPSSTSSPTRSGGFGRTTSSGSSRSGSSFGGGK